MGQDQSPLTIRATEWSQEAGAVLAPAVPYSSVEVLAAQVKAGAVLFRVDRGGVLVGFYLLRVDGDEGVLVAGAGCDDQDLTAGLVPVIEGQFKGCKAIRIHTARPGLARKLSRLGYGAGEIVMRKTL